MQSIFATKKTHQSKQTINKKKLTKTKERFILILSYVCQIIGATVTIIMLKLSLKKKTDEMWIGVTWDKKNLKTRVEGDTRRFKNMACFYLFFEQRTNNTKHTHTNTQKWLKKLAYYGGREDRIATDKKRYDIKNYNDSILFLTKEAQNVCWGMNHSVGTYYTLSFVFF